MTTSYYQEPQAASSETGNDYTVPDDINWNYQNNIPHKHARYVGYYIVGNL